MDWHSVLHLKLDEAFTQLAAHFAALDEEYERNMAVLAQRIQNLVDTRS